jgi:hypothetical protein
MKNKKLSRFEKLCEAIEEENLFDFGNEEEGESDIVDDYEGNIDDIEGEEGEGEGESVTITISSDQVTVLSDILTQIADTMGDEEGEEGEEEDEFGSDDIEALDSESDYGDDDDSLNEEAVEFETPPSAESVQKKTKSGKAAKKVGDLDQESGASSAKEGPEKPFRFVRKEVPQELKHKTTSGS